jgi:hypothetical protein
LHVPKVFVVGEILAPPCARVVALYTAAGDLRSENRGKARNSDCDEWAKDGKGS